MRRAALAVAGAVCILLSGVGAAGGTLAAGGAPAGPPLAFCLIEPGVMDVRVNPGALVVRVELFSPDGLRPLDAAGISPGVHLTSVGGTRLPFPGAARRGLPKRGAPAGART